MSSGGDPQQQSRKRPIDNSDTGTAGDGGISSLRSKNSSNTSNHRATQAQEYKRRQIMQKSWGFREVLAECGVLEFAAAAAADDDNNGNGNNDDDGDIVIHEFENADATAPSSSSELGCQLEPNVSSSTLRSSIHALLSEMSKNGIDPNNARVLKDMEDMIVVGGGSDNHVGGSGSVGGGGASSSSLLRRMLLPLYRIRSFPASRGQQEHESEPYYDFSQFSQPDVVNGNNDGTTATTKKTIVESSSLIKVLLRVDALQPTLLTALMQKIPELATPPPSTEQDEDNVTNYCKEEEDVPRLIFSNMRWLDHIVDYSSLTNAFVECLTILASSSTSCAQTRNVLLDAIATLPDVLNDSYGFYCGGDGVTGNTESSSNPILSTLQLLRAEDPTLLVPVLDAIGSLPLLEDQMHLVMRDALEALSNVEGSGLPALTTFVMNHCPKGTTDMAREVIEEMRKLPLGSNCAGAMGVDDEPEDSFGHERNSSGNRHDSINGRSKSSVASQLAASSCLTIESLSRGFAHRPDLTLTLLKSIKETPMDGYHPPADIWLLACCASAPHNRPKVKSIFKSKANAGMFISRLLRESLSGNGMALTSLFGTSLCDLADGLLRSSSSSSFLDAAAAGGRASCELGVTLYEILFEEFPEPMHRQEIVGCLVTHVGSGVNTNPSEVDAALRVFCGIIDKSKDGAMTLRPFAPFLTSMLDHLHHMTPYQVRRLFLILFAVGDDSVDRDDAGATGANMRGGACDDVQIVIRKHLALAPFAMQRIGIIGTVAFAVSRSSLVEQRLHPGTVAVASSPIIQEIKDMISSAYSHCKPAGISIGIDGSSNNSSSRLSAATTLTSSPIFGGSSMAFFLDELCHAVQGGRLAQPVKEWIDEMIISDFENWFVADFEDATSSHGTKTDSEVNDGAPLIGVPKSSVDLALLDGTSKNRNAPPGEIRFHVTGVDADVYIKILSLLSSHERTEREFIPVQLSPMFRLMSTLNDQRYGGVGLREIDAVLDCPLLLPSQASGMEFKDLSRSKQWVVTSSYYFATSWMRQLINSFIHEATESTAFTDFVVAPAGSCLSSMSSQGMNYADVQKRIIARLGALVELEEELSFSCSQCYEFSPPGLDILLPPKLLLSDIGKLDNVENEVLMNKSKESKKVLKEIKKQASQLKKAKHKHEEMLIHRTFGTLRNLDPQVCVALGFGELSIMGSTNASCGSQGLSQIQQVSKCGGPVTMLLLKLLQKVLSEKLYNRKIQPQVKGDITIITEDSDDDNPYASTSPSIHETNNFVAITSCDDSSRTCFALLDRFLRGCTFASLYEHLAAVAELRCGPNRKVNDHEAECQLVNTARCLFSCVKSIMGSEMLTKSATGRMLLASITKQIAQGDRNEYSSDLKRNRISTSSMKTLMGFIADNVNEIVVGAHSSDLGFVMDGVTCMQAIFECSQRLSDSNEEKGNNGEDAASSSLSEKLFTVSDKLLHKNWPDDTKMNNGNIGLLLSLFVEHSPNRMKTLSHLVNDVLQEVRVLEKGEVVPAFPTCSHQTIAFFHSTVLRFLWKEIEERFNSTSGKTKDSTSAMKILQQMADLLKSMAELSHEHSNKKFLLLQHLKFGSRFLETFVLNAIPFCQVNFSDHQESILDIIRCIQTWSRGLYHIVSHGKRKKDAMLAKEAPRAKKALETFIHKVKAMLKKNNCMTAMWTKTLKSKSVDGKVLNEDEESQGEQDDDCSSSQLGEETESSKSDDQLSDNTDTDEEL